MTRLSLKTRLAVSGLLAGLAVAAVIAIERANAAPGVGDGKAMKVPFEMLDSNHMVVRAKLNGKGPYRLVFDLGAPVTLLGNQAAEASGVVDAKTPKLFLFSMRGEATIGSLSVGDLDARDVPAIVFDHPVLKALAGLFGRPLDGIIGFTFFAKYKTTIDYQAREMTFEPVDYEVRDLLKSLPDRLAGPKSAREITLAPLGLWGLSVSLPAAADTLGLGLTIDSVSPDTPAARAGLKPGDLLTILDGRWTATLADAFRAASSAPPGRPVDAVIVRDGKEMTLAVTPAAGF